MGKIVMPKNSALLNEVESVLKIYYEANGWLGNDEYKRKLKELIGDDQYASSYTKKAQITSYFGFTIWKDINNPQSERKITEEGKVFYDAIVEKKQDKINECLMNSLETTEFGRNNYGCPESNSDIEPPCLFIRSILDLGYLSYKEFAYLLWKMEDIGKNYSDAINEIKESRKLNNLEINEEANKYVDCKPIMVLNRWGFLEEDSSNSNSKHIKLSDDVINKYKDRLRNLKIYNIDKDCSKKIIQIKKYTINELADILNKMYSTYDSKTSGIHMFGIQYGKYIKDNNLSVPEIVNLSGISDKYVTEVNKGIRISDYIDLNKMTIKLLEGKTRMKKEDICKISRERNSDSSNLNTILYGAPGTGKTYQTPIYALSYIEKVSVDDIKRKYKTRDELIKKYNEYISKGFIEFTTFHQNYGYEDFVQGIKPKVDSDDLKFSLNEGVFKKISDAAVNDNKNNYVIVIDEINRGNISKIFGELITLIEPDKRWGEKNQIIATLPSGDPFVVPNNLYILGTMNSADKSISLVDVALRRRFRFIEVNPDSSNVDDKKLAYVMESINNYISQIKKSSDLLIGQSYFIGKTINDLEEIMNNNIIPLLYEYFYDEEDKVLKALDCVVAVGDYKAEPQKFGRIKVIKIND